MTTPMRRKIVWCLLLFCQGVIIGIGAILPGVVGSVLCVIFGIYEPMMALLAHPLRSFQKYYKMFIPFLTGWLIGFILFARMIEFLFTVSSVVALALFAGLVFGTLPELMKKSYLSNQQQSWLPLIISMVIVFVVLGFLQTDVVGMVNPNTTWYVFCGAIWGLSLVIPGLSATSILIFLGLYQSMTTGIAELNLAIITPVLCGLLLTIILCARAVNKMFEKWYAMISKIVLGIMIASTLMIMPTSFTSISSAFLSAMCFGVGIVLARGISKVNAITLTDM